MSESTEKFYCGGCQHGMTWKQEFAGRRIKCKRCGHAMVVPAQPGRPESEPEPQEDDLYALSDLASDARAAAASLPPTIVEAVAAAPVAAKKPSRSGIPLAYQQGPTPGDARRAAANSHIDPPRDLYVPIGLLLVGTVLYIGFYAIHYNLGGIAIISTSIGLTIMTVLETAVLFGFALAIASPLGVSFGGIGTALLKLAAIAVFCDGLTTWADGLFAKYAGHMASGGLMSFGVIGFPVALAVYWTLLTYLFSMDPGDARLVVIVLAVFSRILRIVLLLLLLKLILSFGGIGASAVNLPSMGGSARSPTRSSTRSRMPRPKTFCMKPANMPRIMGDERKAAASTPGMPQARRMCGSRPTVTSTATAMRSESSSNCRPTRPTGRNAMAWRRTI